MSNTIVPANTIPIFTGVPVVARVRINAANTTSDGSATVIPLVRGDGNNFTGNRLFASCTADTTTEMLTVTIPDLTYYPLRIKEGTIFEIVSGTPPTGLATATKYMVVNLVIASTTSITFQVLSLATLAVIDLTTTGTSPVIGFNVGSRVDSVTFTNSQATAAASSIMVGKVYISDEAGANYRMLQEIAIAAITRSVSVIGAANTIYFSGGLIIQPGVLIAVTQSVYAGVQDQQDVILRGGDY